MIDHGGQGRRFAAAGRPGNQNQAAILLGNLPEDRGQVKLLDLWDSIGNDPEDEGNGAALLEYGDAESPQMCGTEGKVDFSFLGEDFPLAGRQQLLREVHRLLALQGCRRSHRKQFPIHPEMRDGADFQMEVRRLLLNRDPQQRL